MAVYMGLHIQVTKLTFLKCWSKNPVFVSHRLLQLLVYFVQHCAKKDSSLPQPDAGCLVFSIDFENAFFRRYRDKEAYILDSLYR